MINKKNSEFQTTLYSYNKENTKLKQKQTKKQAKKIEQKDRCASKVMVVGSSNELSSHPFPS